MKTTENLNDITTGLLMSITGKIQTKMLTDSLDVYMLLVESPEHNQAVIIAVDKHFRVQSNITEGGVTTYWKYSADLERSLEL